MGVKALLAVIISILLLSAAQAAVDSLAKHLAEHLYGAASVG